MHLLEGEIEVPAERGKAAERDEAAEKGQTTERDEAAEKGEPAERGKAAERDSPGETDTFGETGVTAGTDGPAEAEITVAENSSEAESLPDEAEKPSAAQRIIIFCKTKQAATNIGKYLVRKKGEEQVRILHGNKAQNTRINAINDFREGNVAVLVATDVVSRGIDITGVSHVINFDIPLVYEDYVHRIGRTGRMHREGDAISFCSPSEIYHLEKIQELIRQKIPVKALPPEVEVSKTPFEEQQAMAREMDHQRRKEDPDFQGAFHDKKKKNDKDKR
ncbi:hypothetical protein FRZ59_14465 [Anseongella ginsenosidimutans]|nr:hypothetical protein FRZ59_14465 [Anseongella ginsenosidimutans]